MKSTESTKGGKHIDLMRDAADSVRITIELLIALKIIQKRAERDLRHQKH